jgi:hypothetical protein
MEPVRPLASLEFNKLIYFYKPTKKSLVNTSHKMKTLAICLLLISTGCFFGDRGTARTVELNLPGLAKANTGSEDVQNALSVINRILISNGLSQVQKPVEGFSDGTIGHYQGPPTSGCAISLNGHTLVIQFEEFYTSHSSGPVKNICATLENELKRRYGSQRVRVNTQH